MTKYSKQQRIFASNLRAMGKQAGFTLIELMIAIILGMLVVAAALAIFIGGQRALNVQQGMGSVQESAIFGLNQLTYFVRHANLNSTETQQVKLNDLGSGIIFNANNFPVTATSQRAAQPFTQTGQRAAVRGVLAESDSLAIQYMPSYDRSTPANFISTMVDCEGRDISFRSKNPDSRYVSVHRFYVDLMPASQQNADGTRYALYCDASYYDAVAKSSTGIDNIGGQLINNSGGVASVPGTPDNSNAIVLIPDIEAFKVRLGVKNAAGSIRYMPINQYTNATENVVSVELGILVRSNESVGNDDNIDATRRYDVAGTTVQINTDNTGTKRLREAFSQVVALRNAQGSGN
ncbi:PilW family protein [Moraxella sp. ZY210820]|uniref:PilW family protein n=1 Tax=unclassified Moraxella TaxID=2685852 RepID=UPI0027317A6B|nr:PilW family protein [Moraxella sp. ZY210820]WLF83590.1 PilW family protein [Moraxella sp. ZY210820]